MTVESESRPCRRTRRRVELALVGLFVLANFAVPLVVEDFFPFTTTPMFRDKPRFYSDYRLKVVHGGEARPLEGSELAAALSALELNRTYDGNPPGLGVGQRPPATLDRFSEALTEQPDEAAVRRHVQARLDRLSGVEAVLVIQEIVGPLENGQVGVVRRERWRVERAEGTP